MRRRTACEALRGFWNSICRPRRLVGHLGAWMLPGFALHELSRKWVSGWAAWRALTEGQPGFFAPRWPLPVAGFEQTKSQRGQLLRHGRAEGYAVERSPISTASTMATIRVSVGAVNVRTGNLVYFDNTQMRLRAGAFHGIGRVATGISCGRDRRRVLLGRRIGFQHAADRGAARCRQHKDTLVFQVDLWSASGNAPADFLDVTERTKDIQYSSRTRAITNMLADRQRHARFIKELLAHRSA